MLRHNDTYIGAQSKCARHFQRLADKCVYVEARRKSCAKCQFRLALPAFVLHGLSVKAAGSLLHEGRANSGSAQSPLGWVGRFLHFSEIPQSAPTEAVAVEFTQPSHRDDLQGDNVTYGFATHSKRMAFQYPERLATSGRTRR